MNNKYEVIDNYNMIGYPTDMHEIKDIGKRACSDVFI